MPHAPATPNSNSLIKKQSSLLFMKQPKKILIYNLYKITNDMNIFKT